MNKIYFLAVCMASFSVTALPNVLKPSEIVPAFYTILLKDEDPTLENEREFFGGIECDSVRAMLSSNTKAHLSQTPIWDYLRSNRDWFITEDLSGRGDLHDRSKPNLRISDPFTLVRLRQGTNMRYKSVLVMFPSEKKVSTVVFTLGETCYLEIATTVIRGESVLLASELFHHILPEKPDP